MQEMTCAGDGINPVIWAIWEFRGSSVQGRVHCCTNVSDLNHFHVLPSQYRRNASTGDLPTVPPAASPQVPSMRMCCEADELENHNVSVLALLSQRVCWPHDCESNDASVATGQER